MRGCRPRVEVPHGCPAAAYFERGYNPAVQPVPAARGLPSRALHRSPQPLLGPARIPVPTLWSIVFALVRCPPAAVKLSVREENSAGIRRVLAGSRINAQ